MNAPIKNMAHSARERLKKMAHASGRSAEYLYQRYAFERFYYRIGKSEYSERFILKGASLFTVWMGPMFRVTQDTDLESNLVPDHGLIAKVFRSIASLDVSADDGVRYDMETLTVTDIKKSDDYKGVRVKFCACLEQAKVQLQFDIGFGDSVYPSPVSTEYPTLLGGDAPILKIYPQYTVVAEKFSAIITLGMMNSRLKDYFDLWVLSKNFQFDLSTLQTAICRTFKRKKLILPDRIPLGLQPEFYSDKEKNRQWNAFLRKIEPENSPGSLKDVSEILIKFFDKILVSQSNEPSRTWQPSREAWIADDN